MAGTRSKQPTHSGEGRLVSNLVTFIVLFACFLGALYSLTWLSLDNVWPMVICLVVASGVFFVAFTIGRSDTTKELAEGLSHNEG